MDPPPRGRIVAQQSIGPRWHRNCLVDRKPHADRALLVNRLWPLVNRPACCCGCDRQRFRRLSAWTCGGCCCVCGCVTGSHPATCCRFEICCRFGTFRLAVTGSLPVTCCHSGTGSHPCHDAETWTGATTAGERPPHEAQQHQHHRRRDCPPQLHPPPTADLAELQLLALPRNRCYYLGRRPTGPKIPPHRHQHQ